MQFNLICPVDAFLLGAIYLNAHGLTPSTFQWHEEDESEIVVITFRSLKHALRQHRWHNNEKNLFSALRNRLQRAQMAVNY